MHHEFQEVLGGRLRELPHPEIVDDEQRDGRDVGDVLLAGAGELGLGEVVEERMRFAVEDAVALLDHREADGLDQVALAATGRSQKQSIRVLRDPACGRELEDEGAVHFLVEVEGIEALVRVAEIGLLDPPLEEAILAADEFILDEAREEVEGDELLSLRLEQPRLEAGAHAGAAELAEGALQFDEVHVGISSWVFRAMTSR